MRSRAKRLIFKSIEKFELNLDDLIVLTEAASGNYIYTPIIAALAGAKVFAVTRDSKYAPAIKVIRDTIDLAEYFGVRDRIDIFTEKKPEIVSKADIVTNLGFVRPIDKLFISYMKPTAVIPLMFETWEYRQSDLDLQECRRKGICVLGTNEEDPRLRIFEYLGHLCAKKIFEKDIEIFQSKIIVIGGGKFGLNVASLLSKMGANVTRLHGKSNVNLDALLEDLDVIITAEHEDVNMIIGRNSFIHPENLHKLCPDVLIVNLAGKIDRPLLDKYKISYIPKEDVKERHMGWPLSELGPKPVIDLHTAGLKVGEIMVRLRLKGLSPNETIREALKNPLCQNFNI